MGAIADPDPVHASAQPGFAYRARPDRGAADPDVARAKNRILNVISVLNVRIGWHACCVLSHCKTTGTALGMAQERTGPASEVADEIKRYLVDHPEASDNLIGVVTCWLNRDPSQSLLSITDAALGELVSRGEIDRFTLPDGGALFRKASRG